MKKTRKIITGVFVVAALAHVVYQVSDRLFSSPKERSSITYGTNNDVQLNVYSRVAYLGKVSPIRNAIAPSIKN